MLRDVAVTLIRRESISYYLRLRVSNYGSVADAIGCAFAAVTNCKFVAVVGCWSSISPVTVFVVIAFTSRVRRLRVRRRCRLRVRRSRRFVGREFVAVAGCGFVAVTGCGSSISPVSVFLSHCFYAADSSVSSVAVLSLSLVANFAVATMFRFRRCHWFQVYLYSSLSSVAGSSLWLHCTTVFFATLQILVVKLPDYICRFDAVPCQLFVCSHCTECQSVTGLCCV